MNLVEIEKVVASTYNPRQADEQRLAMVELSLRKLGFLMPGYATASGEILSGHQRQLVARRMGFKMLPIDYVADLDLSIRKSINICFNRATNDMKAEDTPEHLTEQLLDARVADLAAALPDIEPNSPKSFRCLDARPMSVKLLCEINSGRWIPHALNVSKTLMGYGVFIPLIVRPSGMIVNGIGRLQAAAERGMKEYLCVQVSDAEADFAEAMLNKLTMSFDVHRRYADELRYNSFRRPRGKRDYLGRAFTFAILGANPSKEFDITDPKQRDAWRLFYGRTVLDFGAGLLDETNLLRASGIDCTPFEPFLLHHGNEIWPEGARDLARAFFDRLKNGVRFDSLFLSAVLNSVPFIEDRRHVVYILSALCDQRTRVYACSSSTKQAGYRIAMGEERLNKNDLARLQFRLDYEPRVTLADFSSLPKVQKYHTAREWYDLWHERFELVKVTESSNNVECVCQRPLPVDLRRLSAALEFEFNLAYPDGSRMGLQEEAKEAFRIHLTKGGIKCL